MKNKAHNLATLLPATSRQPFKDRIEGILPSSRAGRPRSRPQREQQKMRSQSKSRALSLATYSLNSRLLSACP